MTESITWNSDELVKRYQDSFSINIEQFIQGDQVVLARDPESGILRFDGCQPGSGNFYEQLAQNDFYYMEEKWEYQEAIHCFPSGLSKDAAILDIGCGGGGFLDRCRDAGYNNLSGIEFNEEALKICRDKGLDVTDSRIEHVAETDRRYDIVCAFQVLEHVPDPVDFVRQASRVLTDKGRLILCTPNADSFFKRVHWHLLDMPPHHMSRLDQQSYEQTCKLLGLSLRDVRFEPLAKYHHSSYANSLIEHLPRRSVRRAIVKPLVKSAFKLYPNKTKLRGHSIMAVIERDQQIATRAKAA